MQLSIGRQEQADVMIYPLFSDAYDKLAIGYELKAHMGERGAVTWFFGRGEEPHMLIVGLGETTAWDLERLREAAGNAGRAVEKEQLKEVNVSLTALAEAVAGRTGAADLVTAWVEGWQLGTYAFDKYKAKKAEQSVEALAISCDAAACECGGGACDDAELAEAIKRGEVRANGTALARSLCNEPPNAMRPYTLAERVTEHFAERPVSTKVYKGEELEKRQMNGLRAVGRGSVHPPALIEVSYCTAPDQPLIALVGKGVTFDTGGISLKKGRNISDMRMDMGGAAAVIGALDILTSLKAKVNVVGLISTAENMPDGGSLLPGEVIEYPNDLSVQVGNTDAEGRLVLADALLHAKTLGATKIVDIATLTGACGAALGPRVAGVLGGAAVRETLQQVGDVNGDGVWPLPLIDEYEEALKSDYADICNISSVPYGGAITAALFLRRFVSDAEQWAHVDMAGPMDTSQTKGYQVAGATGYGARLLADFVLASS
ncbi:leucyl aminopeptidase family protein [Numidum massiliense]|uniref:leucyl aminopeptidase family protein n=1 Tax=Numidum massiliense TaxID=1522315 RepID=UPI0006D5631B|nr:leucyl aminopeptidase family protein [Numidum massiliense]